MINPRLRWVGSVHVNNQNFLKNIRIKGPGHRAGLTIGEIKAAIYRAAPFRGQQIGSDQDNFRLCRFRNKEISINIVLVRALNCRIVIHEVRSLIMFAV